MAEQKQTADESAEPTKAELQEQAREAGVPVSGTKDEIAERLAEAGVTGEAADDPYNRVGIAPTQGAAEEMADKVSSGEWQAGTQVGKSES